MELYIDRGQLGFFDVQVSQADDSIIFTDGKRWTGQTVTSETIVEFANAKTPELLLGFAQKYGAVFGMGDSTLSPSDMVIESLESLEQARSVLDECLRMRAFIDGELGALNNADAIFVIPSEDSNVLSYTLRISRPQYVRCIQASSWKQGIFTEGGTDTAEWDFSGDLPVATASYLCGGGEKSTIPQDAKPFPVSNFFENKNTIMNNTYVQGNQELADLFARKHQSICELISFPVEAILRTVIMAHVQPGVYMGFDLMRPKSSYSLKFNTLLARMWHEFGGALDGKQIRLCKQCGVLISGSVERSNKREYCGKECRDKARNKRNSENRKRARELSNKGYRLKDIAKELGVKPSIVKGWIGSDL